MIDTIYVERAIASHPRALTILARFPKATTVSIERYGEVFNKNRQSFRLQKRKPSLILAEKRGNRVLPAPRGYGIGSANNYYFSHILNCVYDCRYCFLQGMYRSAHYVVFVNFEDFHDAIVTSARRHPDEDTYFFSGYDGDSLALDSLTGFVDAFVPFFASHPTAYLELRTKSATIRPLVSLQPPPNVIVAFSFTPELAAEALEHGVPPIEARIGAMQKLSERGYRLGLRFDPLLYSAGFVQHYRKLFESVFRRLDPRCLHSVSFGPFRMPRDYFHRMQNLYPEEKLFAAVADDGAMASYPKDLEATIRQSCEEELRRFIPEEILFSCRPSGV